jgi:alkyl hydroperoxide reductase subunit AhpC
VIEAYDLLNPDGAIAKAAVIVVDKKGIVRWMFLDENYRIRPVNETILSELRKLK